MRRPWQAQRYEHRITDDQLEQLISESIESHPGFWTSMSRAFIVVEVERGYATMTGIVRTELDRRLADLIARTHGARGVNNRLRLEADVAKRTS